MEENPYEPPKEVNDAKRSGLTHLLLLIGAMPAGAICFFVTCTASEFGAAAVGIPYPGIIPFLIGAACGLWTWRHVRRSAMRKS
jgi:hypothetical protein